MAVTTQIEFAQTSTGEIVVQVLGRATMQQSQVFAEFVEQRLASEGSSALYVDLVSCEYLDSTFLGCLLTLHKRFAGGTDGAFLVVACEESRQRLLRACRLDQILNLCESTPEVATEWTMVECTEQEATLAQHVMECHRELSTTGGPLAAAHARIAEQLAEELTVIRRRKPK